VSIHFDGDFPTGKACKHHCSPSCHPAQVGPDWKYGCLHPAWPENQEHDFCPIVNCGGDPTKCEVPKELLANARLQRPGAAGENNGH
jgi:hypothetical protein